MIPHGTISGYTTHKCRCEPCKKAKSEYQRAWLDRMGRKPRGNACTIDGVTYPSQMEAARALGVPFSTISYHLNKHGDFSRLGRKSRKGIVIPGKPVTIGSRTWPSRSALARYLGTSEQLLTYWREQGHVDSLMGALMAADAKQARAA